MHFTLMVGFCLWVFAVVFLVLFLIVFCQRQAIKLHACACTAEGQSETWPEQEVCWS